MKTQKLPFTKPLARKLLNLIDAGLTRGIGHARPGEMCIMACFNHVLGRQHGDNGLQDCVGAAVRSFDIALNDSDWSSKAARAQGMRRESIAKIGSNQINQDKFSFLLSLRVAQQLLPAAFRDYAQYCKTEYKDQLTATADACAAAKTNADVSASLASLDSLYKLARLANLDSLSRLARLASLDSLASLASLYKLARLDSLARLDKLARVDKHLAAIAEVAVQVLIELKSPGCAWLDLCDASTQV